MLWEKIRQCWIVAHQGVNGYLNLCVSGWINVAVMLTLSLECLWDECSFHIELTLAWWKTRCIEACKAGVPLGMWKREQSFSFIASLIQRVKTSKQQFGASLTFLINERDARVEKGLSEICSECQMGIRLRKNGEGDVDYVLMTVTGKDSRNTYSLGVCTNYVLHRYIYFFHLYFIYSCLNMEYNYWGQVS